MFILSAFWKDENAELWKFKIQYHKKFLRFYESMLCIIQLRLVYMTTKMSFYDLFLFKVIYPKYSIKSNDYKNMERSSNTHNRHKMANKCIQDFDASKKLWE